MDGIGFVVVNLVIDSSVSKILQNRRVYDRKCKADDRRKRSIYSKNKNGSWSTCKHLMKSLQSDSSNNDELRMDEVVKVLENRGIQVKSTGWGTSFGYDFLVTEYTRRNAMLNDGDLSEKTIKKGAIRVGMISCLRFPGRIHIESVRVADFEQMQTLGKQLSHHWLQLGGLLGLLVALKAKEMRIEDIYGLAIDDSPDQHRRLVAFMKRLGCKEVRYVGDGLEHIGDRVIWGGRGLIMKLDPESTVQRFTKLIRKELQNAKQAGVQMK
uniref:Uncharacterized protein n=1 Tax=Timspurckia oligopyrenoides TaxID=708627 RepID=A0A7S0ZGQ5_9RHOD